MASTGRVCHTVDVRGQTLRWCDLVGSAGGSGATDRREATSTWSSRISDATGGLAGSAGTTADSVAGVRSAVGSLAGRAGRLRELLTDLQNGD